MRALLYHTYLIEHVLLYTIGVRRKSCAWVLGAHDCERFIRVFLISTCTRTRVGILSGWDLDYLSCVYKYLYKTHFSCIRV